MDVLIPLGIIVIIAAFVTKKFKPELWNKTIAKFKK